MIPAAARQEPRQAPRRLGLGLEQELPRARALAAASRALARSALELLRFVERTRQA